MTTKYVKIRGEVFPYEEAKYSDTYRGITGKHLFVNMLPTEVPERYAVKLSGLVSIQDLAEAKVLREHPEMDAWTYFGTRPKGYWALVKAQMRKTLYWAINKQPKSLTIFTNVVSGLEATGPTESYTVYGLTQLCMQLGVITQIVIPATGYVCKIEPVCNKKQLPIFTGQFICEELYRQYIDGTLPEEFKDQTEAIEAKYKRLQAYRKEVQDHIWEQVNTRLSEYRDAWKAENLFTLPERMVYAIHKQTEDILLAYRESFNIPARDALTLEDLLDLELQQKILTTVGRYAAAFGLEARVTERVSNFGTYTPKHWLRDDKQTLTEAVLLRRALRQQRSMQPDPLNELLTAYIQIDYYLSLGDFSAFLVDGYGQCAACGDILSRHDECCPRCDSVNPNYEPQTAPYDTVRDCVMNNWSDYLEE